MHLQILHNHLLFNLCNSNILILFHRYIIVSYRPRQGRKNVVAIVKIKKIRAKTLSVGLNLQPLQKCVNIICNFSSWLSLLWPGILWSLWISVTVFSLKWCYANVLQRICSWSFPPWHDNDLRFWCSGMVFLKLRACGNYVQSFLVSQRISSWHFPCDNDLGFWWRSNSISTNQLKSRWW